MPVRVAGSPSLDRLIDRMIFSFQTSSACVKMMLGNGMP